MPERTLPALFEESVAAFPGNVLMWEKKGGAYAGTTYREMQGLVHRFAAGLMDLGIAKGDRLALVAEGRNDWLMSEVGILSAGAINVPISVKIDQLDDLKFRLAHSGCRAVVVSRSQLGKIRRIKGDLPALEWTILLDPEPERAPDEIFRDDLMARGEAFLASRRAEFDERRASLREADYANICYTSGTTADPKGIILTHRNYTANVDHGRGLVDCPEHYVSLIFLPWDHAFAHTCGLYTLMKSGAAIASVEAGRSYIETLKNVPLNIRETRPHILLSVPAVAKNFRKTIERGIREKGPRVEALFRRALRTAYAYNAEGWNRGLGKRKLGRPAYAFFDRLIFRKIRENFGGRLEFFVGGGALLDIELQRFFYAIGIPMFQGYGLTEAAPVISSNNRRAHKLGSSGKVAPGIEIRIRDESGKDLAAGGKGEIVIRGENVMAGYWKNEKATREALRDGWLFTGDLGYLDEDGFLYVLGRVKSLLIGGDGEKYSPEGIEEAVTDHSPYIDQLMLHNNQSPYTVGLVVPNREAVLRWLKEKGLSCATREGQEAALDLLEREIGAFQEGGSFAGQFPPRWLPAAFAVLGEGFTEENGLLNSQLKMVRGKIEAFYADRIEHLYTPEGKDVRNPRNMTIIARFQG